MGPSSITRRAALAVMAAAVTLLAAGSAHSITCEECREIDKNVKAAQKELTEKAKELKNAFDKKEYSTVTQVRNRMNEIRLKLLELRKQTDNCRDACRPDVVKAAQCRKIKTEIAKLDTEGPQSADQKKRVDQFYRDLAACNRELRRILGGSD